MKGESEEKSTDSLYHIETVKGIVGVSLRKCWHYNFGNKCANSEVEYLVQQWVARCDVLI